MVLPGTEATVRLADVLTSCWSALRAEDNPLSLAPVSKAAVLVVDGMGAHNLRARKGHARWLSENWSRRGIVGDSGFPSTTASALASLTTGCGPGEHGIVGYTVRDPRSGALINHLKEWEPHVDPLIRCNIWHVRGRDRDMLIDTGLGIASLRNASQDIFDKRLMAVATHTHFDHIGGMHEFDERVVH
ncbi:MAG: alkaline phosphatase family protein, partial [Pontimonas sp.]